MFIHSMGERLHSKKLDTPACLPVRNEPTTYVSGPQSGAHDVAVSWIRPRTRNLRTHVRTPSLSSIRAGSNACVAVLGMSPAYIRTCPCIYILCSPCCCYQSKYSTTTCSVTARSSVHQQIRDNVRTLFYSWCRRRRRRGRAQQAGREIC
jgi:hypothetical protein